MNMSIEPFKIEVQIQELTPKQFSQQKYIILHNMICQEANNLKEALIRKLNQKLDLSGINETLIIRYSRTGRYKFDYTSIKDLNYRKQIHKTIDNFGSFVF